MKQQQFFLLRKLLQLSLFLIEKSFDKALSSEHYQKKDLKQLQLQMEYLNLYFHAAQYFKYVEPSSTLIRAKS